MRESRNPHGPILRESRWLFLLPPLRYARAVAWTPHVLVRPGERLPAHTLAHETIHLKRQEATGRWRWLLRYLLSPSFRLREEAAGYAAGVRAGACLDSSARALASRRLYFLPITAEEASEAILQAMEWD